MMMQCTFGAPRIQLLNWGRWPELAHQGHRPQSSKLRNHCQLTSPVGEPLSPPLEGPHHLPPVIPMPACHCSS